MENTNSASAANADSAKHWQESENEDNQIQHPENNNWDLKSVEANGFGTNEDQEERSIYASSNDDPDEDEDEDGEEDNDDDSPDRDWGTVDPQEHPGIPSDMDPSGPGSAV